jgi:simple sugar transport system ATP-binding protein
MVGRDVSFTIDKAPANRGEPVLTVTHLWVEDDRGVATVADLDLEVHAGEIFGSRAWRATASGSSSRRSRGCAPPAAAAW